MSNKSKYSEWLKTGESIKFVTRSVQVRHTSDKSFLQRFAEVKEAQNMADRTGVIQQVGFGAKVENAESYSELVVTDKRLLFFNSLGKLSFFNIFGNVKFGNTFLIYDKDFAKKLETECQKSENETLQTISRGQISEKAQPYHWYDLMDIVIYVDKSLFGSSYSLALKGKTDVAPSYHDFIVKQNKNRFFKGKVPIKGIEFVFTLKLSEQAKTNVLFDLIRKKIA
jgi:hypothetical protein